MISKKEVFLKEINNEFSIDALYSDNAKFKELYPFCNESGYAEIIKNLQYIEPKCTQKTKVSLLFGESNLLSLLPTLSAISDVIWIADINPAQHEYITFLLDCFKSSDTTEQFLKNYFKNNILLDKNNVYTKEKYTTLEINNQMNHFKSSCGKYYFLNSQSNYDKCKKSLNKVTLLQINLDLSDKDACRQINALLTKHNAVLTYCNFTNIHHYVEADTLQEAVSNLLKDNEHVLIMYSTGSLSKLRVCCTTELKKYLTLGNGNHAYDFDIFLKEFEYNKSIVNSVFGDSELFSKKAKMQPNNKPSEVCYFAFAGGENTVKDILSGKQNINAYSSMLHAHDTLEEVERFVANKKAKNQLNKGLISLFHFEDDDYWIFKVSGNKDKINYLLRYLPDRDRAIYTNHHIPSSLYMAQLKLPKLILEVINYKRDVKITCDSVRCDVNANGGKR